MDEGLENLADQGALSQRLTGFCQAPRAFFSERTFIHYVIVLGALTKLSWDPKETVIEVASSETSCLKFRDRVVGVLLFLFVPVQNRVPQF